MTPPVELRDHMETRLKGEVALVRAELAQVRAELAYVRDLNDVRLAASEKALELAERILDRHLQALNHAEERATQRNAEYLPRNDHNTYVATQASWNHTTERALFDLQIQLRSWQASVRAWGAAGALLLAILALASPWLQRLVLH